MSWIPETGTLYAMKVVLADETEPVTWDDIGADAPYYFITDYMQSYLHDYDSKTYMEIEGEVPYDTNAQIMWDKEAEIKAEIEAETEAKEQTTMGNDNGEYTCDLEYGEHKLHLIATLLNASKDNWRKASDICLGFGRSQKRSRVFGRITSKYIPENTGIRKSSRTVISTYKIEK